MKNMDSFIYNLLSAVFIGSDRHIKTCQWYQNALYSIYRKKRKLKDGIWGWTWRKEERCVSLNRRSTGQSVSQATGSQILEMSLLNSGFTLISENLSIHHHHPQRLRRLFGCCGVSRHQSLWDSNGECWSGHECRISGKETNRQQDASLTFSLYADMWAFISRISSERSLSPQKKYPWYI